MRTEMEAMISRELLSLFEESFERVHGAYLDRGSSLFETIGSLSASDASRRFRGIDETIAAHVNHLIFYIIVLQEYIMDKRSGKTDWSESWKILEVDDGAWASMKTTLDGEYRKLREFIESIDGWEDEDRFCGIVSILVHSAYHLGAIRQLIALE